LNNNLYLGVYENGFTLFGYSLFCNRSDTWSIGSKWCGHIDGNCQMANNSIHHSGGNNAPIWRHIPPGGIAACLGFGIIDPKHIVDIA
jgi:hypothetical protein